MRTLLLALSLFLMSPPDVTGPPPSIRAITDGVWVEFPKGAVDICIYFVSKTETIERDGEQVPYGPSHCWLNDDENLEGIDDNWSFIEPNGSEWDVYALIYYDVPGEKPIELSTNHILLVH